MSDEGWRVRERVCVRSDCKEEGVPTYWIASAADIPPIVEDWWAVGIRTISSAR